MMDKTDFSETEAEIIKTGGQSINQFDCQIIQETPVKCFNFCICFMLG